MATKGEKTKRRILKAAARVFAHEGFVATRMSDVAKEAELSMGGLYRYYGNKYELFEELVGDLYQGFFDAVRSKNARFRENPRDAIRESNLNYVKSYYENRELMRCFTESTTVDDRFLRLWWQERRRIVDRFAHSLASLPQVAAIDGVVLRQRVEAWSCMAEQCCYVWYAQERHQQVPVKVEDAADILTISAIGLLLRPEENSAPSMVP